MVLTKLNQPLLERLARETGGVYLPATPGEKEVEVLLKHLRGWGEQQFEEKMIVEREDQYQVFLVFAFIFLILEMLVRRRNKKGPAMIACLAAFFLFTGFFETSQGTVKKGNAQFQNKQYQSALEAYRKVQVRNPDSPEVLYDLGTALYKVDAFQESAQDLEAAANKAKDPQLKARTLYNYGNAQYRLGNFEKAIESYKKALQIDPSDKDAKYNLEFLQKQKNKIDKKDQEKKKEDQKKDKQEQQNPQQNKQDQQQGQGQKDQENQGQGQQDPQNQEQNKDQKDQQQQQNQQKQDQQQQQNQSQEQQDQQKQDSQKDQQQKEQEQRDQEKQEHEQQQKEQEEKQKQEEQQKQQEPQKSDQEKPQSQQKQPLQGQMSMDNALNLLDALKESEKELQDLRRPPVNKNPPPVEKDW